MANLGSLARAGLPMTWQRLAQSASEDTAMAHHESSPRQGNAPWGAGHDSQGRPHRHDADGKSRLLREPPRGHWHQRGSGKADPRPQQQAVVHDSTRSPPFSQGDTFTEPLRDVTIIELPQSRLTQWQTCPRLDARYAVWLTTDCAKRLPRAGQSERYGVPPAGPGAGAGAPAGLQVAVRSRPEVRPGDEGPRWTGGAARASPAPWLSYLQTLIQEGTST